jgi:hypothetical protein
MAMQGNPIRIGISAKALLDDIFNHCINTRGYPYRIGARGVFKEGNEFSAFDNTTGDCWVEEFQDINKAFSWLKGEFEIGDLDD